MIGRFALSERLRQNKLARLCVAIVGLGGTGSIVAQQLVHLGVRNFIFIDPDVVETTNLNQGRTPARVTWRRRKFYWLNAMSNLYRLKLMCWLCKATSSRAGLRGRCFDCDFIFGCTDSHGSRAVIQQISYQYLIPCIDMGTIISVIDHSVKHIYGRAQLLAPGFACLTCSELLNASEVRRDMMIAVGTQARSLSSRRASARSSGDIPQWHSRFACRHYVFIDRHWYTSCRKAYFVRRSQFPIEIGQRAAGQQLLHLFTFGFICAGRLLAFAGAARLT